VKKANATGEPRDCPCHSGKRYGACCRDLHRRVRLAGDPEELMRSRYAAFSIGLGEYLVDTLSAGHPDREQPPLEHARELAAAHLTQRFLGLRILHTEQAGDEGRVLFHARIFVRGRDRSFVELSTFVREASEWRYASGVLQPAAAFGDALETLTLAEFLRRADDAAPANQQ